MAASFQHRVRTRGGALALVAVCAACTNPFGSPAETCDDGPFFSHLPVAQGAIGSFSVLGQFDPPRDVLPRPRTGVRFATEGLTAVYAIGNLEVGIVESTRWLSSPTREGQVAYGVGFEIPGCPDIQGEYVNMVELVPELLFRLGGNTICNISSSGNEIFERCTARLRMPVPVGAHIGRAGLGIELELDLFDDRILNEFVSSHRFPNAARHAICPQPLFVPDLRDFLLEQVSRNGVHRTAAPVCGSMEVDVEGTAQGMWVVDGRDVVLEPNTAHLFFALAPDDIAPQTYLVLATGHPRFTIEEFGSPLYGFALEEEGRLNRAFAELPDDGTVHCYVPSVESPLHDPVDDVSFFVAFGTAGDDDGIGAEGQVTLERRDHEPGASPCHSQEPDSWAFSDNALLLMR